MVQFVGDALLAVFDAPRPRRDHAYRAARSALAMQEAVEALSGQEAGWPRFRIGVNTGLALIGNVGSAEFRSFSVIGDAINSAARLETAAEPGTVVIGGRTHAEIEDRVEATPLGALSVRGREQPIVAYRLDRLRPQSGTQRVGSPRGVFTDSAERVASEGSKKEKAMPEWQSIDLPDSQAVRLASDYGHRLEVYWVEFNTNDPVERENLVSFLMHPLRSLTGERDESADEGFNVPQGTTVPGLNIDGVDDTWRVITTIHNHHRGLNPRITRFMATVSDDEKTVYLEAHKQPDG